MKLCTKKAYIIKTILALISMSMVILSCIYLTQVPKYILLISLIIFSSLGVLISNTDHHKHESIFKILLVSLIIFAIILVCYIILDQTGLLYKISDSESLLKLIRATKHWGVLVYIIFIIFQVIILPLPAAVPAFIGAKMFGPLFAFIYMSIGTIIGSILTFMLGKVFGQRLVSWMIGKEKTQKYAAVLNKKGKFIFIATMLFPFFPDDIICLVAGMTAMSYKFFIIAMCITRPLMIAATCFFLDGSIIPFSGKGIPVWIAIFAIMLVIYILTCKIKNKYTEKKSGKSEKNVKNKKLKSNSKS